MATAMTEISASVTHDSSLIYACEDAGVTCPPNVGYKGVKVCAKGSSEVNTVCNSFYTTSAPTLRESIGYGSYDPPCNMDLNVTTTCGCTYDSFIPCQVVSPSPPTPRPPHPSPPRPSPPPPSPSPPPPPPPPPAFIDFPHSCYPGNSKPNGGIGPTGTGIDGFPWDVTATSSDNTVTFDITPNGACDRSYGCCDVPLDKIEFVISANCRGAISSVSAGLLPSYQNQSWFAVPSQFPADTWLLTSRIPGLLNKTGYQYLSTTLTLDPKNLACNTADKFLLNSEFWWAGFGSTATKSNACCGTI